AHLPGRGVRRAGSSLGRSLRGGPRRPTLGYTHCPRDRDQRRNDCHHRRSADQPQARADVHAALTTWSGSESWRAPVAVWRPWRPRPPIQRSCTPPLPSASSAHLTVRGRGACPRLPVTLRLRRRLPCRQMLLEWYSLVRATACSAPWTAARYGSSCLL